MSVGLVPPETDEVSQVEFGVRAEALGYDAVWIGELWGENALLQLADVAARTGELQLGTSIVNVYSRSPAVLAMSANSLDRLAGGGFVLGVGPSTPRAVESVHGMPFERPIRRSHEAIELVRRLTAGDGEVDYEGEVFEVEGVPALDVDVPVYNAALGPANRRVTGRLCDGWLPHNVPLSRLDDAFAVVADAARAAGRDPAEIDVVLWVHVAIHDDPAAARDAVRSTVAYYVGASDGYRNAVATGFPDRARRVADAWRAGDRDAARAAVSDGMVADLGCAGPADRVREELSAVLARPLVDGVIVNVPGRLDDGAIERTVEAVEPATLGA